MSARPLGRIGAPKTFRQLRTPDRRVKAGPIFMAFLDPRPGLDHPEVAFAISKACGGAVVRNKVRRRLKNSLHHQPEMRPGSYLIRTDPSVAAATFAEIDQWLTECLEALIRYNEEETA
jgi:ribonuclease P protein component